MKLIFAQGNPGSDYEKSRHNIGFTIVNKIVAELGAKWSNKPKFHAVISESKIADEKVLFVKPTTFYNETGASVRALVDFYKLNPTTDVLVIHDDFSLPFGTIRVRKQGSDAGNNGIKSISSQIGQNFARIRVGIWTELREKMDDAEFVLAKFNSGESSQIYKNIIPQTTSLTEQFCNGTIQSTSYKTIE